MKRHLNTLYVTTPGCYLRKEGEAVLVRLEDETKAHVPLHNLEGIVCFGNVLASPYLLGACGERGIGVSLLSRHGRFLARVQGPTSGNVLLRREQYRRADDPRAAAVLARSFLLGKLANTRVSLQRSLRQAEGADPRVAGCADRLRLHLQELQKTDDLDALRGIEGTAAREYFQVFGALVRQQAEDFPFTERNRRPPRDRTNALLSFLYTLVRHDVASALEAAGLDPAVGFLHRDRPGRPSLALDLMEELRPWLADRLALTLVNRRQLTKDDFEVTETGGVWLSDEGRKTVLVSYQTRKEDEVVHPFLEEKTTVGLLPHLQALLLARHLRGDLDGYPPLIFR
jgi:CRISPR-associated protein Cas1